jgi:orotate phosphoribosyltransferase
MEEKAFKISLAKNPIISIKVIPGHFTTGNAHTNNYLDVSGIKSSALVARDVAEELAIPYLTSHIIDTIVCMEKTEVIGAFLAHELQQHGTTVMNEGNEIHVVTPTNNVKGNMVFQDNIVEWISNKHILLLVASVSSARALHIGMECISYYGGILDGISALFVASPEKQKEKINALFTSEDIPGYKLFNTAECEMCKAGTKMDAIVSSEGYTKIG